MSELKVRQYLSFQLGRLPILSVHVQQVPHTAQTMVLELLRNDSQVRITFTGVRHLRISDLHSASKCQLAIKSIVSDQLEGLRYRVFNIEQQFGLSFHCADFEVFSGS